MWVQLQKSTIPNNPGKTISYIKQHNNSSKKSKKTKLLRILIMNPTPELKIITHLPEIKEICNKAPELVLLHHKGRI